MACVAGWRCRPPAQQEDGQNTVIARHTHPWQDGLGRREADIPTGRGPMGRRRPDPRLVGQGQGVGGRGEPKNEAALHPSRHPCTDLHDPDARF